MSDIQSITDIKQFVDAFYRRVEQDDILGPIFNQVADVDWSEHLDLMYRFWDSVLFASGTYKGNPLVAHLQVNQRVAAFRSFHLRSDDFERWLSLFRQTIDEQFSGPKAEQAKRSALRMAGHLQEVCSPDYQPPAMNLVPERYRP